MKQINPKVLPMFNKTSFFLLSSILLDLTACNQQQAIRPLTPANATNIQRQSATNSQSEIALNAEHPTVQRYLQSSNWQPKKDQFVVIKSGTLTYSTDQWKTQKTTNVYVPRSRNGYYLLDLPKGTAVEYKATAKVCFTDLDLYYYLSCFNSTTLNIDNNGQAVKAVTR